MNFQSYGIYYDLFYSDKNYEKECDFIEYIFRNYHESVPNTILDAGCGTGGHAIPLAKRGYDITGIDISEEMLKIAKENSRKNDVNLTFNVMDLCDLELQKKFDACICMFGVISYFTKPQYIMRVLLNINKYLKKDSLLIFDFWYSPAVSTITPSQTKVVEKKDVKIVRHLEPYHDTLQNLCKIKYDFTVKEDKKTVYEGSEKHKVKHHSQKEIKYYLTKTGFDTMKICPFLELDNEPNKNSWHVIAIAKKSKK